jgi:hypothetical protein
VLKFPNFKLGSFSKSLYGDLNAPHVELPHGQLSFHMHPSLNNIQVGLSHDGVVSFDGPDWKASVSAPNLSFASPKLSRADGLQLLVSEHVEVGVSFDKHSSRHFFFLGGPLASPKFTLNWKVTYLFSCFYYLLISFSWTHLFTLNSTKTKEYLHC